MRIQSLLRSLLFGLFVGTATPGQAGPIQVNAYGSDFLINPQEVSGSRFEGNPTNVPGPLQVTGSFQGNVFGWLSIMRFQSQADFDANSGTAVQPLSQRPFTFSLGFDDGQGHTAQLDFTGSVSGQMSYNNPTLNVSFDNPTGQAQVGDALIDVALGTVQFPNVNPAVTFDGGVSINGPLPIVTDVQATISVQRTGDPNDPTGDGSGLPSGDGSLPSIPEPGTLTLVGLGLAAVATRRWRRAA